MNAALALEGTTRTGPSSSWRRAGTGALAAAFLAGTFGVAHGDLYLQGLVLVAAVFAILALSLDLVAGATGLYSLGHAGLFAFGAFGTTILYDHLHWNVFVLLPVAVVGVGLIGLMIGGLSLRVSGLYFAVTTFVFTLVVSVLAGELSITGGPQGLIGPLFPSFPDNFFLGSSTAWCVMLSLLAAIVVTWNIRSSPLYPVLLAIRDAEPFAASVGVRTSAIKVGIFGISAALAGLAGWAFSFLGVVSYGQFDWSVSVNILVMVLFGGINSRFGPIIGAAFISIFPAYVNINPLWQEVLFGALFLVVVVFFPTGVVGMVRRVWASVTRLWKARAHAGVAVRAAPPGEEKPAVGAFGGNLGQVRLSSSEMVQHTNGHESRPLALTVATHENVPAIECRGVVFRYTEGAYALNQVDFVVKPGTLHGLIGPNGSGKSTLVDLIAGRKAPLAGTIMVHGQPVHGMGSERRVHHGLMRTFQSATLVGDLSVGQNVAIALYSRVPNLALRAAGWPFLPGARRDQQFMAARTGEVLAWVGGGSWQDLSVASVPHGVRQLTQLAAACAPGPVTLVLDEPLAGLSPSEVDHVAEILKDLRQTGVSIVLIEHQTRLVFSLCDKVTVLSAGEVVTTGTPSEVYANTRVREVYLGQ